MQLYYSYYFVFNQRPTPSIYTLSLHDALPIWLWPPWCSWMGYPPYKRHDGDGQDRKSTRLNSSHVKISYAVFCLKKKTMITKEMLYSLNSLKITRYVHGYK